MTQELDFPAAQAPEATQSFRELRIAGSSMSETEDIPDGHIFIVGYGDKPNEDLGESIDCTILRQSMKVTGKWNDDDTQNKHYMYNSSEFLDWGDVVVLYDTHSIPTKIVAALPYSHRNPDLPSIGGKGPRALKEKCDLRLRYVYYVLYNDEVFRMNGGSTDYSGADANDKPMGFDKPGEGSFAYFLKECAPDNHYLYACTLSGKKHSKKIMLKQFAKGKKHTIAQQKGVMEKMTELYEGLNEAHWTRFGKAVDAGIDHLDEWSKRIVDVISDNTFSNLLLGKGKDMFKVSLDSLPPAIEVKFSELPEETQEESEQKVGDLTASLMGDKVKAEDIPF